MNVDLSQWMQEALAEAQEAFVKGEVPVGAVLIDAGGRMLARAHNRPIALTDPTAHAEILVIRKGAASLKNYRLTGATLVATVEPCAMCMGAALNARIARLVYGAPDPKAGAAGSLYNLAADGRLNHRIEVVPGVREEECAALLRHFFRVRR